VAFSQKMDIAVKHAVSYRYAKRLIKDRFGKRAERWIQL